jgi:hypothetical protein
VDLILMPILTITLGLQYYDKAVLVRPVLAMAYPRAMRPYLAY